NADRFDAAWNQHQAPRRQLTKDWRNAVAEGRWNDSAGTEGISPAARLGWFPDGGVVGEDGGAVGEVEEGVGSTFSASNVAGFASPIFASRLLPSLECALSG